MLLRSSSTPILGSLLSSAVCNGGAPNFSDSPNHHHQQPFFSDNYDNSSASSSSATAGFRRANSEGNLRALLHDQIEPLSTTTSSSSHGRRTCIETVPSLSIYNSGKEIEEKVAEENFELMRTITIGESVPDQFGFTDTENEAVMPPPAQSEAALPPLFLARGLGIDRLASGLLDAGGDLFGVGGGGNDGRGKKALTGGGGGGEQSDTEMYYKRMMEEDPGNALLLRNYAQFLYETKGDLKRAEEYYSRAVLAEPGDGEILSKYAKLVWELHHDEERASSYFERAVEAAPNDGHVLAAYAGFLWATEEENAAAQDFIGTAQGTFASAIA